MSYVLGSSTSPLMLLRVIVLSPRAAKRPVSAALMSALQMHTRRAPFPRNNCMPWIVPRVTLSNVAVQQCIWQLRRFRSQDCRRSRIRKAPILRTSSHAQLSVSLSRILSSFIPIVSTPFCSGCLLLACARDPTVRRCTANTQRTPQPAEPVSDRPDNLTSGNKIVVAILRIITTTYHCMRRPYSNYPLPCGLLAGSDRVASA